MVTDKAFLIVIIIDEICKILVGKCNRISTPHLKFKRMVRKCYCTVC